MVLGRRGGARFLLAAMALVAALGRGAGAQPAEKPPAAGKDKPGWINLVDLKWTREGKETWNLTFQASTILPEKSVIQALFRFGDDLVASGKTEFIQEGAIAGEIHGIARANPPAEYTLVLESRMSDQDPAVSARWVQHAGLVQTLTARFPVQFGGPEEEAAARKAEYEAWVAWIGSAREVLKTTETGLGGNLAAGKTPDEACAAVREGLARAAEGVPRLFALSYFRGMKECAANWTRSVNDFLQLCEARWADKQQLPVDRTWRIRQLRKSLDEIAEFVGARAGAGNKDASGVVRRGGGRYLQTTLNFELLCEAPGWTWVERTDGDKCLSLEQPVPPWTECRIEVFARRPGDKETTESFYKTVLARFAAARTTGEEPPGALTTGGVKETKGSKFTWSKDQSQYGWIRACRAADGRLVALVATGPTSRWSQFQPIANGVFSSLSFKSGE